MRVVLVLSVVAVAGCRTWRPVEASGLASVGARPDVVRLVRTDGTQVTVSRPVITSDSIVGYDGSIPSEPR